MTSTAFVGLDYIFDIMHPDGKIARCAKSKAERGAIAVTNQASPSQGRRGG